MNRISKYSLHSLEAILQWMEQDVQRKKAMLVRRQQGFQAFVASLTVERARPEMEYFEGLEGIKKAYEALLEDTQEMLHYMPARYKEEEDPLQDFRKNYVAERRTRGIFSRIISEDTPLGRRFQSKDFVQYRQTLLVPKERYPFFIEQIISGGMIAYLDHEHLKGCILRFSNLAHYDALFFEADWQAALRQHTGLATLSASVIDAASMVEAKES